jgi:hypothetical protein
MGSPAVAFEVKVNDSPYTPQQKVRDDIIATKGGTIASWSNPV